MEGNDGYLIPFEMIINVILQYSALSSESNITDQCLHVK